MVISMLATGACSPTDGVRGEGAHGCAALVSCDREGSGVMPEFPSFNNWSGPDKPSGGPLESCCECCRSPWTTDSKLMARCTRAGPVFDEDVTFRWRGLQTRRGGMEPLGDLSCTGSLLKARFGEASPAHASFTGALEHGDRDPSALLPGILRKHGSLLHVRCAEASSWVGARGNAGRRTVFDRESAHGVPRSRRILLGSTPVLQSRS
mmetsp:Transcript_95526/g.270192  ORF Transcript_95526/g.270192 Transcript_95526/m.270192 type:complete len:208 (-) Transcript_95526:246-869(-)